MESRKDDHDDETNTFGIRKAESGGLPDFMLRLGVCKILRTTCNEDLIPGGYQYFEIKDFIERIMRSSHDIDVKAQKNNDQTNEVSTAAFELFLGDYMKYSCGYWEEIEYHDVNPEPSKSFFRDVLTGTSSMTKDFYKERNIRQLLTKAEENMLKIVMARMEMKDGYNVLDLGCGWGSATIFILENYPKSKVVAIANQKNQREYLLKKAEEKGFSNRLAVWTDDVTNFISTDYGKKVQDFLGQKEFDRIHSCDWLTHVKNWEKLLNMLRKDWIKDNGGLFLHFFSHKSRPYPYDPRTWMGKYFFRGGIMPSHELIRSLDQSVGISWEIKDEYKVNGRHYAKTSEAWLKLFDNEKKKLLKIYQEVYKGEDDGKIWFNRWRIFFITLAEFFGFREGTEWFVSHYYLKPRVHDVQDLHRIC